MNLSKWRVRFLVKNGLFPTCSGLDIVYRKSDIYLKGKIMCCLKDNEGGI